MTISESSRAIVLQFCDCLSRRDFAGIMELMTPDATWWVVGRPNAASPGGAYEVSNLISVVESFLGALDEFSFTVEGSIAEGERVAIEAISSGRKGNLYYNNNYLMRYHVRNGKIQSLREFMDPDEVAAFIEKLNTNSGD
jgi:ketosteroid isomerase-like protein